MNLHIGNGKTVRQKDIVAILDLDTATQTPLTRAFLSGKTREGKVEAADEEIPRSFLLLDDGEESRVILSPISPSALCDRANTLVIEDEKE